MTLDGHGCTAQGLAGVVGGGAVRKDGARDRGCRARHEVPWRGVGTTPAAGAAAQRAHDHGGLGEGNTETKNREGKGMRKEDAHRRRPCRRKSSNDHFLGDEGVTREAVGEVVRGRGSSNRAPAYIQIDR